MTNYAGNGQYACKKCHQKLKIFNTFISSAVEVFPYLYFGSGVV